MEKRDFLKSMTGLTAGVLLPFKGPAGNMKNRDRLGEILPLRKLGKTGKEVTMLGVGGYHVGWTTERDAQEVIEAALEGGVRFFDNAESYGPHTGEIRYGKYLTPKYRDLVFLMTKSFSKDVKTARKHFEESLKRMNTDYLDLWQIHSLQSPEDVDVRLKDGFLELVRELKESGKVKHVGFTGHADPNAHVRMFEQSKDTDIFDTVQMPVNLVDMSYHESFFKKVFPLAMEKNMAVLAMKTLADGRFFSKKDMNGKEVWKSDDPAVGRISLKEALYFVWSLPVSVLITGAENATLIREKIELARNFKPQTEKEREKLIKKVADLAEGGKIEYYKAV